MDCESIDHAFEVGQVPIYNKQMTVTHTKIPRVETEQLSVADRISKNVWSVQSNSEQQFQDSYTPLEDS